MLSAEEILNQIKLGNIIIKPFKKENLEVNSYYVHLGNTLVVYDEDVLDCKKSNATRTISIPETGYMIRPGELYLASTVEYTETQNLIPVLNGRFSIGALGLTVHITAGFGDNGFKGKWTIQLSCVKPIRIYADMKIAQLYYFPLIGEGKNKYMGKYLGQIDPSTSKLYREFIEIDPNDENESDSYARK